MEFRRYLKERLTQLRANEALNITETTPDGKGIRKVEFNPQRARSLVSVPYHKQIVFNLNKSLKGLDNFLRLEGYDKNKIEKVHLKLRKSKISSPRRDRETNIPPPPPQDYHVLANPQTLYFYGALLPRSDGLTLTGNIFGKYSGQLYNNTDPRYNKHLFNVYFYKDNGWTQEFNYENVGNFLKNKKHEITFTRDDISLHVYPPADDPMSWTLGADLTIKVDLYGNGNYLTFQASGMYVTYFEEVWWFCKNLDGPSLSSVIIGDPLRDPAPYQCSLRGINPN